jgi:hypothetical protein
MGDSVEAPSRGHRVVARTGGRGSQPVPPFLWAWILFLLHVAGFAASRPPHETLILALEVEAVAVPFACVAWLVLSRALSRRRERAVAARREDEARQARLKILRQLAERLGVEEVQPEGTGVCGSWRGRRVAVSLQGSESALHVPVRVALALESPSTTARVLFRPRGASIPEGAFEHEGLVVETDDPEVLAAALEKSPRLGRSASAAVERHRCSIVDLGGGEVEARLLRSDLDESASELLQALLGVAEAFESRPVEIAVLGGARRALSSDGQFRCAFCHDSITGQERDLVACDRCQTVLHDACWNDLGRCPTLGCAGRSPERPQEVRGRAAP